MGIMHAYALLRGRIMWHALICAADEFMSEKEQCPWCLLRLQHAARGGPKPIQSGSILQYQCNHTHARAHAENNMRPGAGHHSPPMSPSWL